MIMIQSKTSSRTKSISKIRSSSYRRYCWISMNEKRRKGRSWGKIRRGKNGRRRRGGWRSNRNGLTRVRRQRGQKSSQMWRKWFRRLRVRGLRRREMQTQSMVLTTRISIYPTNHVWLRVKVNNHWQGSQNPIVIWNNRKHRPANSPS